MVRPPCPAPAASSPNAARPGRVPIGRTSPFGINRPPLPDFLSGPAPGSQPEGYGLDEEGVGEGSAISESLLAVAGHSGPIPLPYAATAGAYVEGGDC